MGDLMHCLRNFLFLDILLLYCYTKINSSIICFLFSGDMYLSFGVSDSSLASLFCGFLDCNSVEDVFEKLIISSSILLPIKSPVASAVFWIFLFEAVFIASVVDFFAPSRGFWPYFLFKFLPMFLAKTKIRILLHIFYP